MLHGPAKYLWFVLLLRHYLDPVTEHRVYHYIKYCEMEGSTLGHPPVNLKGFPKVPVSPRDRSEKIPLFYEEKIFPWSHTIYNKDV